MKSTPNINRINAAFEAMSQRLRIYAKVNAEEGRPIRSVTFRVLDNGNTKTHVTWRKVEKPKSKVRPTAFS